MHVIINSTPEELARLMVLFNDKFEARKDILSPQLLDVIERSTFGGPSNAENEGTKEPLEEKKKAPGKSAKHTGGRKKLPRDEIKGMYDAGFSAKEIAEKLGAAEGTIDQILRKDLGVVKEPLDTAKVRACLAAGKDIEWLVVEFGERYREDIEKYVKELEAKS